MAWPPREGSEAAGAVPATTHLRLQSRNDVLAGLHDGVQLPGDHDGEALVFGKRQLQVGAGPLHDLEADLRLLAFSKLVHVLVLPLLQGHVEHLRSGTGEAAASQGPHPAAEPAHAPGPRPRRALPTDSRPGRAQKGPRAEADPGEAANYDPMRPNAEELQGRLR